MKSVTEFQNFKLLQGLKAKATLTADGKTAEEIQQNLGETFKYEGDKLKHFTNALDVAALHPENLSRVVVMSLAEGETAPAKATQVEEFHYVPEFINLVKPVAQNFSAKGKGRQGGRPGGGGPKESPWGLSPEQKAAKKNAGSKSVKPS